MDYSENQTSSANYYFDFLKNLNNESKIDLISKLSQSITETKKKKERSLKSLFGAYKSDETSDEIIATIRNSRVQNRIIESF